jgi:hypothetical protein
MATATLEERMAALEKELAQLKQQLHVETPSPIIPWWEKIAGTFANSENYDEAMRLGREYRESLRPKDDEEMD